MHRNAPYGRDAPGGPLLPFQAADHFPILATVIAYPHPLRATETNGSFHKGMQVGIVQNLQFGEARLIHKFRKFVEMAFLHMPSLAATDFIRLSLL
jgi:hypothetical protein